jgi:hypothetical protein
MMMRKIVKIVQNLRIFIKKATTMVRKILINLKVKNKIFLMKSLKSKESAKTIQEN